MSTIIDLNFVCIICLQDDGDKFISVFADSESKMHQAESDGEMTIAEKIAQCSDLNLSEINIKISNKICDRCLNDLFVAWRFRKNCDIANSLFKSIQQEEEDVMSVANSEVECGNVKLLSGLQMKRVNSANKMEITASQSEDEFADDINQSDTENCQDEIESFSGFSIVEYIDENEESESKESIEYFNCLREESLEKINSKICTEKNKLEKNVEICDSHLETEIKQEILGEAIEEDNDESLSDEQNEFFLTINKDVKPTSINCKRIRERVRHGLNENSDFNNTSLKLENSFNISEQVPKKKIGIKKVMPTPENKSDCTKKISSHKSKSFHTSAKICEICGNIYKYQHALSAHMRRHNNDRQFGCELCDKAFVSNVELRRHMRVHTGQKPYPCSYCDRRFSDFGSRSKHERTHTGERPYRCTTCNKSFAYPHVLTVHLRTHTGEKKFQCTRCGRGFTKKAYLLAHLDNHARCESISLISRLKDDRSNIAHIKPDSEITTQKEDILWLQKP